MSKSKQQLSAADIEQLLKQAGKQPADDQAAEADESRQNLPEEAFADAAADESEAANALDEITAEEAAWEEKLALAEAKAADYFAKMQRAQAEAENSRRVAEKDIQKAHKFALEDFAKALLPIVDSLEQALKAHDLSDPAAKKLCEGVELTMDLLLKTLKKFHIEPIDPLHKPFDPALHQAISTEPSQEHAANTVINVLQKGYRLKERLIRPALVTVAKSE